ncbi:hypothetical protein GDO78_000057 [Eleutherodactylus coqui]|uniref:Peptidase metallopeptidase domain-containing protein n=1 Tax=Eleutherodactylus coqui TaxID=57060 RepID=A0A8J6FNU2_ELECQ|nr:hypothetical protein GDO78_000057 [Eleutherodactylus coqui]
MEDKITYKRLPQSTNRQHHEIKNMADLLFNGESQVKQDGLLDELRCGVPDVAHYAVTGRDLKWKSMIITYRIVNYSPGLPPDDVDHDIREALKMWSKDLLYSCLEHGDFFPFDGPGGVLAHAFPPGEHLGGDVHFDDEETWTVDSEDCSLFSVAVHEFGHTLGLAHSSNPHALMYPIYTYFNSKNLSLPADDVLGIQALYGSRPSSAITPTICSQEVPIDAMAHWEGGIIIFKDRYNRLNFETSF